MEKNVLKASSCIEKFREIAKDIPLSPQSTITRWGTWLNASLYCSEHFECTKWVVNELDSEDAISIKKKYKKCFKVQDLTAI